MNNSTNKAGTMMTLAMIIFGTIGIFRKFIYLPSGMIAMSRGLIGMLFLISATLIMNNKIIFSDIKKNLFVFCVSGVLIGINWIMLFEAYRYTSVAVATLCYYMAPVFTSIASIFLLGEKFTVRRVVCTISALLGMVLVSGVLDEGIRNVDEIKGILLGTGAALLYAIVVILNKKSEETDAYCKTLIQIGVAGICLIPYVIFAEGISQINFSPLSVSMLFVVGILHTGIAYTLYFGALGKMKAQTAAILSYIDPAVAIILSVFVLGESIGFSGWIGAVLIIGAAFFSERGE